MGNWLKNFGWGGCVIMGFYSALLLLIIALPMGIIYYNWWGTFPMLVISVGTLLVFATLMFWSAYIPGARVTRKLGHIASGLLILTMAYYLTESYINGMITDLPKSYLDTAWTLFMQVDALLWSFITYYYLRDQLENWQKPLTRRLGSSVTTIVELAGATAASYLANYALSILLSSGYRPVSLSPSAVTITAAIFYIVGYFLGRREKKTIKPDI